VPPDLGRAAGPSENPKGPVVLVKTKKNDEKLIWKGARERRGKKGWPPCGEAGCWENFQKRYNLPDLSMKVGRVPAQNLFANTPTQEKNRGRP